MEKYYTYIYIEFCVCVCAYLFFFCVILENILFHNHKESKVTYHRHDFMMKKWKPSR